jgi:hypothetical protein
VGSSTDTRNFGMRRFTNLVREGRFRSPAATALRLGTGVEIDPGDVLRVRSITTNVVGGSGDVRTSLVGVIWYEHDSQTLEGQAAGSLVQDNDTAPANRMVQVLHGPGAKVWFRNTLASTTEPGLNFANTRPAVTMVDGMATLAVGDLLGWDSTPGNWAVTADPTEAVFRVTAVNNALLTCDAEFLV